MSTDRYTVAFSRLLELVKSGKDFEEKYHRPIRASIRPVINIGDNGFSNYAAMVATNEERAASTIEAIAVELFAEMLPDKFHLYPISEPYKNLPPEQQVHSRPFQIVLNKETKRIGVVFSISSDIGKHYDSFRRGRYSVDELIIVRLIDPDENTYASLISETNEMNALFGTMLSYMTLREFWESYFGENEYLLLVDAINQFNVQAQEIIGFSTVITPSQTAIEHFRVITGEMLKAYRYADAIPSDVYEQQIEIMYRNYIDRGLWKAMVGHCNFAISFITSEWHYNMHRLTESFDLTWVAAGYLKSVEQLLYAVIALSKGHGLLMRSKERLNIEFTEENEEAIDTTLWGLEWAIKKNRLLDVNSYAERHITQAVKEWRKKERNGYFHKDNLQSIVKVEEIRTAAIQLYFLILGGFTISQNQLCLLGIHENYSSEDIE